MTHREEYTDSMTQMKYDQSGLNKKILRAVREMGFETMTPIQAEAMPVLLEGRDVIGQAQTGTGKTAAFGIPLLQKIEPEQRAVQAIVLCPTRELAMQAAEELRKFSKFMHGIKIAAVYGGTDMRPQIRAIRMGSQVVIGTPGRVMDMMRRHILKLENIHTVVLDEADEMLDMGFREDMETILAAIPQDHQTALFSATMPQSILDITGRFQKKDAVFLKMQEQELTVDLIKQYYVVCKDAYKTEAIRRIKDSLKLSRSLIFCNTKKMVDLLASDLKRYGYQAEGLHGDLDQDQRDAVMKLFRAGKLEFLIATDVAARGIDVDDLEAVFNYDVPQDTGFYVHRIGRTGRAGKEGLSFTLINGTEMKKIQEIERVCKTKLERYSLSGAVSFNTELAEPLLLKAKELISGSDLSGAKQYLERKQKELKLKAPDLAAALLMLQAGGREDGIEDEIAEAELSNEKKKSRRNRKDRPEKKHISLYEDEGFLATFERPGRTIIRTRGEAEEANAIYQRQQAQIKSKSRNRHRRKKG